MAGENGHTIVEFFFKVAYAVLLVPLHRVEALLQVFEGTNKVAGQILSLDFPLVPVNLCVLHP